MQQLPVLLTLCAFFCPTLAAEVSNEEYISQLREAAKHGHVGSMCALGRAYLGGDGTAPADYSESVKWYRMAAEQGDAGAQYALGHAYENGVGVPQDYRAAAGWYKKSAEQGNASAQYFLGIMRADGRGVPLDAVEALKWFRKAAAQGDDGAKREIGNAYENGIGVAQDLREAIGWYRQVADREIKPVPGLDDYSVFNAQICLGNLYAKQQNFDEAKKWYTRAAEQGLTSAQLDLGRRYANGAGIGKDLVRAYMWLNLAASAGDVSISKERDEVARSLSPAQIAEGQQLSRVWTQRQAVRAK